MQAAGLHRRAKHLIVLDADSTLLQGEMIDLLAERCGCGPEVAAVTAAAMAGELDFAEALRQRVRLLAGLGEADLEAVRNGIVLTPGARTLVRTLKRLGYELAVVSGGFTQLIGPLADELGIDHVAANVLVVEDGVVTGELDGPIVDRAGKATALAAFAAGGGRAAGPHHRGGRRRQRHRHAGGGGPRHRLQRQARRRARRRMRRSACPTSTPSSSCSGFRDARWSWPTGSKEEGPP